MSPAFSFFALFLFTTTGSVFGQRRITTSVQTGVDFDCPDEFGYYPHPADCTQYYVCVFGGALQESCTGGLMYSHELQTCDWPRNVGCTEVGAEPIESATASSVTRAEPISRGRTTSVAAQAPSRSTSSRGLSQQQHRQQQQQRQDELVKQQLYADELGPAEEIESDRQQRVYRGQPSNIGQVARDRDGLGQTRHQVTNAIPASRDKLQYQTQQQPQQQAQQQQAQYRVEVTREPPPPQPQQQQVYIVQQTSPRAPLYNTSRQAANTYDGQQYDLYNLYDEDVELYRDTDYGQYSPSPQSVPSRGRQPIVDVYQQQPATPSPAPIQQDYQNTYQLEPEVIEYETVSLRPQIKTPSRFTPRPSTQQPAVSPSPITTPSAPSSRRTQAQVQPQRTSSTPAAAAPSPDPSLKTTTTSTTTSPTPSILNKTPRSLINQAADAEVEPRIITHSQNPSRVPQNQKITLSATLSIQGSNSTRKTLQRGPEIVTVDSFITEEGKLARRRVTIKKPINTTPLPITKGRGRLTYQESLSNEDSSSYEDSGSYEDYSSSREDSSSSEKTLVTRPREKETNSVVDNESTTLRSRYIRPVFADVEDFDDDAKDALRRHPIHEGISGNNRGVPIRIASPIVIPDSFEEDSRSKSSLRLPKENVQINLNAQGEVPIRIARPPTIPNFSEDDSRSKSSLHLPKENVQIKLNAQGEVPIRIARPPTIPVFSEEDNRSKPSFRSSKENVEIKFNAQSFVRPRIENESNKNIKSFISPKEENYNSRKSGQFSSAERPSIEWTSSEIDDSEIENKAILSRNQGHKSFTTSSHEEKENIRETEFNQPSKSSDIERGYRRPISDLRSSKPRISQEIVQSDVYKPRKIEENSRYNSRTKVGKDESDSYYDNKPFNSRTAQENTQEFNQPKLIDHALDTTRFPNRTNIVSESPKINRDSKLRGETILQPTTEKPIKEFNISVREKTQPENDVVQKGQPRPVESYIPQTLPSGTTPIPSVTSKSTPMHNATSEKNDRDCNKDRQCRDKNKIRQQITNTRNRGSSGYTSSGGLEAPLPSQQTVNRGTPSSVRSRPTLKPSTAIVSKAQEFIDIYRFPPSRLEPVYPTPTPDKTAAKCRKDVCLLPDCNCGGKDIPGDYNPENIPQLVLLTFDDSVNDLNKGLYSDLFEKGRLNPNGCPISATFYVSHEWTDYSQVQNLYADGHEMASHSVSHSFGEQFSQKKWNREIGGQREILSAYGGVKLEDVRGMRAPFLAVGGNKMFKMLYDSNFTYDSSMPVYENRPPSWPYTLDYKLFHDCMIPPCPTRSYPGVWEVPMVMWQDLNGGRCSMGDACSNPPTADGVYKMLVKNFERHYTTNRAPFGLFYHAAWFTQAHHKEAFISFLDTINAMKDVWLVTNWQAIQWIRDPTPNDRLANFQPFQCNYPDRPKRCNNAKVCNLWHKSGVRYMRTCQPCPDIYPWTGKTGVRNSRVDNEIEE